MIAVLSSLVIMLLILLVLSLVSWRRTEAELRQCVSDKNGRWVCSSQDPSLLERMSLMSLELPDGSHLLFYKGSLQEAIAQLRQLVGHGYTYPCMMWSPTTISPPHSTKPCEDGQLYLQKKYTGQIVASSFTVDKSTSAREPVG